VQHAGGGELVAEEDVLGDAEPVDDVELLVHGRDAHLEGRDRVGDRHRLALPHQFASVGLVGAREDLDEGGFARAVLPEHAMHLARSHLEIDAPEGGNAREGLGDPAHRQ